MKDMPDFSGYSPTAYENESYKSKSLLSYCMKKSHKLLENQFSKKDFFDKVIEIGSGIGIHLDYVRHQYNNYLMTDYSDEVIKILESRAYSEKISIKKIDGGAMELPFPDNCFDRLIASHVLEHIYHPEKTLREWNRIVKNGGIISIALPCDPGIAHRFGRYISTRRYSKRHGISCSAYDVYMALQHVNPIINLRSMIEYLFENKKIYYWPFPVRSMDINLFYLVNIKIEK